MRPWSHFAVMKGKRTYQVVWGGSCWGGSCGQSSSILLVTVICRWTSNMGMPLANPAFQKKCPQPFGHLNNQWCSQSNDRWWPDSPSILHNFKWALHQWIGLWLWYSDMPFSELNLQIVCIKECCERIVGPCPLFPMRPTFPSRDMIPSLYVRCRLPYMDIVIP